MSGVRGKPWRMYPKGTGRGDANWPIEVREAWAVADKLRSQLQTERAKTARLSARIRAARPRKPKLPAWRQRSGRAI